MDDMLLFDGIFTGAINFAMQQNYVPVIRKLTITNLTDEAISNIEVSITTSPAFTTDWSMKIDTILPDSSIDLEPVKLVISAEYLFTMTEKILGTIVITAISGDQQLAQMQREIDILAYDQWVGLSVMPEMHKPVPSNSPQFFVAGF